MDAKQAFDGAVDLTALDDVAGHIVCHTGRKLAVRNPPIGLLRQLHTVESLTASVGDIAALTHMVEQCVPEITREEIDGLSPQQIGVIFALATRPAATLAAYGRLADPNAARGPASSSGPVTGPVTSSGASLAPQDAMPTG